MKVVLAALLLAACSDRGHTEVVDREPPHQRRVIEPPSANVRLRPPHAIHADAVGPYKLGTQLESVLAQLPSGPRLAQYDIPGVVHQSVLRADDTILIGGEPRGAVGFIAVVGGDVAKTESGIHVGSSRDELVRALGPLLDDPDRARDPRVLAPSAMPSLRVVIAGDTVAAFAIRDDLDARGEPEVPKHADAGSASKPGDGSARRPVAPDVKHAPPPECTRPAAKDDAFGACLAAGELVTVDGDDLTVRSADGEHTIATQRVSGLVFAAPLRDGDRDDLVAVGRIEDAQQRTWTLVAYHLEAVRPRAGEPAAAARLQLVRVIDPVPLYQLTSANVRWIGAELHDVELYVELASRPDAIEVGGLLTTRVGDHLRDVLAISPVSVPRKRGKFAFGEASEAPSPPEPTDAGVDAHGKPAP